MLDFIITNLNIGRSLQKRDNKSSYHLLNMQLKEHELDWLAQKLQEHLDGSLLSLNDIQFFYKHMPTTCLYSGEAYRVIYHTNHKSLNFNISSNKCFSKSLSGLEQFIKNQKYHNSTLPYKTYKANISGIDVNQLVLFLNDLNYEITTKYFFEEEIVANEISYIEELL